MKISFIFAMDENRAIGYQNRLPWNMPADLAYFRQTTADKPIIMGRKTYESIGRLLPKRRNIIITRDENFTVHGAEVFNSTDAALTAVRDENEVMIIGGAELFRQLLPRADKIYLTIIHHRFKADTFLDPIDFSAWQQIEKIDNKADAENPYDYTFSVWERK